MLDIHVSLSYSPLIENQDLSNELRFWNTKYQKDFITTQLRGSNANYPISKT